MKYLNIINRVNSSIWCAKESTVKAVASTIANAMVSGVKAEGFAVPAKAANVPTAGSVGVVQIYGIIGKHLSELETWCGGCDIDNIRAQVEALEIDPNISAICLDIDSPGGVVTGVPELADYIASIEKPVFAYTSGQMCSAAYWIACAADFVASAPSADVGSVGVYMAWIDSAERMANDGDRWIVFQSGTDKAAWIDGRMTENAAKELQGQSDKVYSLFTSFVTRNRNIASERLQGLSYMGSDAWLYGMVDANVDTFEQFVKEYV